MRQLKVIAIGLIMIFFLLSSAEGAIYDICSGLSDDTISSDEFSSLFKAIRDGDCNDAVNLKTRFSMTKEDINRIALKYDMIDNEGNPLVFFREGTPSALGMGAIIVYGNEGDFPIKLGDNIHMWSSGNPKDIIIEVEIEGCDPYDDKCDAICSYEGDNICDPLCYRDGEKEDVQCDIDCIDINNNGIIDSGDLDGICDLDCYNDDFDPNHAYDPDCALSTTQDNLCDPDAQGSEDGICDPDCAATNQICDPDCNGIASDGNPNSLKDLDCYECDRTCNGYCSESCSYSDRDPDCPYGFKGWFELTECCGNSKCGTEENCHTCTKDCPPDNGDESTSCSSLDIGKDDKHICYPTAYNADSYGCANLTAKLSAQIISDNNLATSQRELSEMSRESIESLVSEGSYYTPGTKDGEEAETCTTISDCSSGLRCGGPEGDTRCCPEGSVWDGTQCTTCRLRDTEAMIVAIRSNLEEVYSDSEITQLESKIDELITALNNDWIGARFIYLDDASTAELVPGGKIVTKPDDESDISAVVQQLIQAQNTKYIIIIGGYKAFPQRYIGKDPYGLGDNVYSDDYYGEITGDNKIDIPVGRFPDPNNGDIDVLLNALDTSIRIHNAGGTDISDYYFSNMGNSDDGNWFHERATGLTCSQDSANCESYINDCQLPNFDEQGFASLDMHGSDGDQVFAVTESQEGSCVSSGYFTPTSLGKLDVTDSIWFPMPCYAAKIDDKSTTAKSISLTYMKNKGAVYVGDTCTTPAGDGCIGDLYAEIIEPIRESKSSGKDIRMGDAYVKGKNEYLAGFSCQRSLTEYQYHQLTYYGDPTIEIRNIW